MNKVASVLLSTLLVRVRRNTSYILVVQCTVPRRVKITVLAVIFLQNVVFWGSQITGLLNLQRLIKLKILNIHCHKLHNVTIMYVLFF